MLLKFLETPNKIYSFRIRNQHQLHDKFSENALKNMYSLQESLVIFYPSNVNETQSFIDYLIPQLYVRQRPKCLIINPRNVEYNNEYDIINVLTYAWKKSFLIFQS